MSSRMRFAVTALLAFLVGCSPGVCRFLWGDGIIRYDDVPVTAAGQICYNQCEQTRYSCMIATRGNHDLCVPEAVGCFRACPGMTVRPVYGGLYAGLCTGGPGQPPIPTPSATGDRTTCKQACEEMGRGAECTETCDRLYQ